MKWSTILIALVAVGLIQLMYFIKPVSIEVNIDDPAQQLATSLLNTISNVAPDTTKRFAVGYNGNIDYIMPATALLEALGGGCPSDVKPVQDVHAIDDFLSVFAHYFSIGGAAERFIQSDDLWAAIESAALTVSQRQVHAGGQGTLMGNRLAAAGYPVLLGALVGPVQETLVHPDVLIAGSLIKRENNTANDDPHMILEYSAGTKWCGYVAPRANRFIISRDLPNARLEGLEYMHGDLAKFNADVLVISGMHLLSGQPLSFRTARLADVVTALGSGGPPVHLELAGMGDDMLKLIMDHVGGAVDSLGLNEQELLAVVETLRPDGCDCNNDDCLCLSDAELATNPSVDRVIEALEFVLERAPVAAPGRRRLSRLHFHTVSFHAIVQLKDSCWGDGSIAVAQSTIAATLQACGRSDGDVRLSKDKWIRLGEVRVMTEGVVRSEERGNHQVFVAPLLNCLKPGKTVGLGDSISATGLAYHDFYC